MVFLFFLFFFFYDSATKEEEKIHTGVFFSTLSISKVHIFRLVFSCTSAGNCVQNCIGYIEEFFFLGVLRLEMAPNC